MKPPESDEEIPDFEHSVAKGPEALNSLTESSEVKGGYMIRVVFDPQDSNRHRVLVEGLLWRRARPFDDPGFLTFSRAKNHLKYVARKRRMEREKRWGVRRDSMGRFL